MKLLFLLTWFAVCAEQDARYKQIANGLTLGGFIAALAWLLYSGQTWLGDPATEGGWALLLALAMTLPGYALGRLGAGDVKLLAALALASNSLYLLGTFIGAGIASVIWLVIRRPLFRHAGQRFARRYAAMNPDMTEKFPFSPLLLAGLLLAVICIH